MKVSIYGNDSNGLIFVLYGLMLKVAKKMNNVKDIWLFAILSG